MSRFHAFTADTFQIAITNDFIDISCFFGEYVILMKVKKLGKPFYVGLYEVKSLVYYELVVFMSVATKSF